MNNVNVEAVYSAFAFQGSPPIKPALTMKENKMMKPKIKSNLIAL
tara:strand:+ start:393 stop:527 length:135 start_codon:yes stop_codon:yes gene_type:complete